MASAFKKPPLRAISRYTVALRGVWGTAQGLLSWALIPVLRRWPAPIDDADDDEPPLEIWRWLLDLAAAEAARGIQIAAGIGRDRPDPDEVSMDAIDAQFAFADLIIAAYLATDPSRHAAEQVAGMVDGYVRRELGEALRIPISRDVPGLQWHIDEWRRRNIVLIESGIRASAERVQLKPLLSDVEAVVRDAYRHGMRVESLSEHLQARYGISKSRANLIARDQVLKLNGQINGHRQAAAGIAEYEWSTSRDERTRKSHRALQGTRHKWISPPAVGHPGQDYQCRCVAIPVPPDWLEHD